MRRNTIITINSNFYNKKINTLDEKKCGNKQEKLRGKVAEGNEGKRGEWKRMVAFYWRQVGQKTTTKKIKFLKFSKQNQKAKETNQFFHRNYSNF